MTQWRKAAFKGKDVWASVGEDGQLAIQGGRVPIRYSEAAGARVYRAGATRVELGDGPSVPLPEGTAAPDPSPKGESKAGPEAETPPGAVVAFTDGACHGNPGPAGSGALLRFPDGREWRAARALGQATNNIAELTAIGLALDMLDEGAPDSPAVVWTDSSYAIGVLRKGWKAKANTELVSELRGRLAGRPVELRWVKGHAGTEGNEAADELANRGARGESFRIQA
ncbi:MAG: ribonuclease H [Myxococcota bacterium]